MSELMSINEAVALGRTRFRLDKWVNDYDHFEIYIWIDQSPGSDQRSLGPWVKLWSPVNKLIGQKNPQTLLSTLLGDPDAKVWRRYVGPPGEPWDPKLTKTAREV